MRGELCRARRRTAERGTGGGPDRQPTATTRGTPQPRRRVAPRRDRTRLEQSHPRLARQHETARPAGERVEPARVQGVLHCGYADRLLARFKGDRGFQELRRSRGRVRLGLEPGRVRRRFATAIAPGATDVRARVVGAESARRRQDHRHNSRAPVLRQSEGLDERARTAYRR